MHRTPSHTTPVRTVSHPSVILLASATLLGVITVAAWVALVRTHGSPQTAVQRTAVPQDTRTLPASQGPAEACEHHVVQALSRYVQQTRQGDDPNMAVSDAMSQLSSVEFETFSGVLNSFLEADETGWQSGLAAQVKVVQPAIRRGCAQA